MKNFFEIIKTIYIPIILLVIVGYLLLETVNISDKDTLNVILGVALGVVLGFIVNMFKDSIDEIRSERRLKKVALKLLEQDARKIHRTMWLYDRLLSDSNAPEDIKKTTPPPLEFRYWGRLSQNDNFLLLGAESPFDEIFNELWEFEKINEQIFLVKSQKDNKQAYVFAMAFYKHAVENKNHRQFLAKFIPEKEVVELEKRWLEIAKNQNSSQ